MNVTITYQSYDEKYNRFVFTFNDLDGYEVIEYVDRETGYTTDYDKLQEVARLLNAYNAFRYWKDEQKYSAIELREALESIARNNQDSIICKTYRFATLGDSAKSADKILIEAD